MFVSVTRTKPVPVADKRTRISNHTVTFFARAVHTTSRRAPSSERVQKVLCESQPPAEAEPHAGDVAAALRSSRGVTEQGQLTKAEDGSRFRRVVFQPLESASFQSWL
ncbi:hypothetical protein J6590_058862 [Homalodisca vitripennis]|nr:hypothetical protein J6590_058862 [Homalodisca vitripennis]